MLVPPESSSAVLVTICSKSVSICNRSLAKLIDSSRNRTFSTGYPNLMHSYRGLLEPRGSKLTPLKSTFNAENFICRLSWSIWNGFGAIHSLKCASQHEIRGWAEFKPSIMDKAIDQWRPRLRACVRASGQHFEQLINWNNCLSLERLCSYRDTFSCKLRI